MSKYHLAQDIERCTGCRNCEIQCKLNMNVPEGTKPCKIIQAVMKSNSTQNKIVFVFTTCFHCDHPWCVLACPSGAMQKRNRDGIVFIDEKRCVGCRTCLSACPWGAPQWNPEKRKAVKCDLCKDNIDKNQAPSCVSGCISGSLKFDEYNDMLKQRIHHRAHPMQITKFCLSGAKNM